MNSDTTQEWQLAMQDEISSLHAHYTWELQPLPRGPRPFAINGFIVRKPSLMFLWKNTRPVLASKAVVKNQALISLKPLVLLFVTIAFVPF